MSKKALKIYDSILGHYSVVNGLKKIHLIKIEEKGLHSSIRNSVLLITGNKNLKEFSFPSEVNARIESSINKSSRWKHAETNDDLMNLDFQYGFFIVYDIKIASILDLKNVSYFLNSFNLSVLYSDSNGYNSNRRKQYFFSCLTDDSQQVVRSYLSIYSRMHFEATAITTPGVDFSLANIVRTNIVNNISSRSLIIRKFNAFSSDNFIDFKNSKEICEETLSKLDPSEVNDLEIANAFSNAIKIRETFIFVQNFMNLDLVSITAREEIVRRFTDSYSPEGSSITFDIGFNISNYKFIFLDQILDLVKRIFQYCLLSYGNLGSAYPSIELENPEVLSLDIVKTLIGYCNTYVSECISNIDDFDTINLYGDAKIYQYDFSLFTFNGNKLLEEEGDTTSKKGLFKSVPPLVFEYDQEELKFRENNVDHPHSFENHYDGLKVFNFKKMSLLSKGPWSYMGKFPKDFSKKTPEIRRNFSFRTLLNEVALSLETQN